MIMNKKLATLKICISIGLVLVLTVGLICYFNKPEETVKIYKVSDNSKILEIPVSELDSYLSKGEWSDEPTELLYNSDGGSMYIKKSEVEKKKKQGWSTELPKKEEEEIVSDAEPKPEVKEPVKKTAPVSTPKQQPQIQTPTPVVESEPAPVAPVEAPQPETVPSAPEVVSTTQPQLTYVVFTKSNLTVDQIAKALGGTPLAGNAQDFYDMEQTYNVNALFALSVAYLESGCGVANANVNNFFGFRATNGWMSFATPRDGIFYFGKLMNTEWYYGKTLEQVGVVYCNGDWAPYVKRIMNEKWNKIFA